MTKQLLVLFANALIALAALTWADESPGVSRSPQAKGSPYFGEAEAEPGFFRIFNGKNLDGWEGLPDSWTVKDGAICSTGVAKQRNWLIWRGDKPADFELRLQYRFEKGNSGVQVRSKDLGDFQVRGYQVEIAEQAVMGLWHHSLMSKDVAIENARKQLATAGQRVTIAADGTKSTEQFAEPRELQRVCKDGQWNDLTIIARGENIVQMINGIVLAELTDRQDGFSARSGAIAFQDHGKGTIAAFRNIRIKFLNGADNLRGEAAPQFPRDRLQVAAEEKWQPLNTQQMEQQPPSPQQSLKMLEVPAGFQVTLAAAEPDVRQPIAIAFDDRGRLWVAESYSYDGSDFTEEKRDRILIFEDRDGDGTLETRKIFQDGLNRLTGLAIGFGGIWISAPPNVSWIPDKNGDDNPDGPPVVHLNGWTLHAEHNSVNGLTWGPDGWLYGRHGTKQPSNVGRPGSPEKKRIELSCCIWRYHPIHHRFEVVADGTVNPWGLDFDDYGQAFFSTSVIDHLWHLVPGAHYQRRRDVDEHPNPYVYELIEPTCDHVHWGYQSGAKKERVAHGNEPFGGGHSHCDAMIYLGDRWPEQYRGRVFMSNIHGRRVNQDRLSVNSAGRFVAQHDDDFLVSKDSWFRAVSLEYGPDGDVYLTDWSDLGECHDRDGIHRSSGRIYKISWGAPRYVAVDLAAKSNQELVDLQQNPNEWFVRHARRLLQERYAAGQSMQEVHARLQDICAKQTDTRHRLRAMWALYVTGGTNTDWLLKQLKCDDQHIQSWAIRLLMDAGQPREEWIAPLVNLAESNISWLVRMEMASALQRFPSQQRWPIAWALAANKVPIRDADLERMIWYAIEPAVASDPLKSLALAEASIPSRLRRFIGRRIGDQLSQRPELIDSFFVSMQKMQSVGDLLDLLTGLNESLVRTRPELSAGRWNGLMLEWSGHENRQLRRAAITTGMILGSNDLVQQLGGLVHDKKLDQETRHAALSGLIARQPPSLAEHLRQLIQANEFLSDALRASGKLDSPELISTILARYGEFDSSTKPLAIDALIGRTKSASRLLDAVESGRIPAQDISAQQARQIAALSDPALTERLTKAWGTVNSTPTARKRQIAELKRALKADVLIEGDLQQGHSLFQQRCAACHQLFGEGKRIAPDLTGSQRSNLDYLLLNVIDPNAAVPANFRLSVLALADGRVVTGCITATSEQTLTVQTREELVHLRRDQIDEMKTLSNSLMPEDLLKGLSLPQIRDLIAYLMSDGLNDVKR
ncbi:MAG TPA: PVC-type heme-binding CxxCH protein [Pirellulaceae bacterium]|jgi:putative membrane-bound dehydrogenase-like protein